MARRVSRAEFARMLQRRAARVAVGASTVRGQGRGTVAAAREFLARLDLTPFGAPSASEFARQLDLATARMMRALPRRASSWGLARKLLNIFLRDCLYTGRLDEAYGLHRAQRVLELPLDKVTARKLRDSCETLPRWRGVKHLDRVTSVAYQMAANEAARGEGIERVHLDALWWGGRK